ncbi:XdhC family protein [Frigidibacter sp.]|uniref:XdhC family protein n=1 Tax=Frigidibacter sp. TaxID=2586418 RepID=UPI0027349633|nr:XdhC family protein [Frigidibacter sp.]MDP3339254.1 XdhC family protein [Frigidibacter sp.]
MLDPWDSALTWGAGTVLAVLTATEGPAYRSAGAAMAIHPDGRFAGAITSGCIEADLILRAAEVRETGQVQDLRYGQGSPFFDLRLPCGGAAQIRLFPLQDTDILDDLAQARARRRPASLLVSAEGRLAIEGWQPTRLQGAALRIGFLPPLRFLVFGTGAEAAAFTGIVRGMGYEHILLSPEDLSLGVVRAAGSPVMQIDPGLPAAPLHADADTAAILFFHDHDLEPAILQHLLQTPAFYVGAQGSRAAQAVRLSRLREMGVPEDQLGRIHGPVGLIPSSREPNALAVSVLAEIIDLHVQRATATA